MGNPGEERRASTRTARRQAADWQWSGGSLGIKGACGRVAALVSRASHSTPFLFPSLSLSLLKLASIFSGDDPLQRCNSAPRISILLK